MRAANPRKKQKGIAPCVRSETESTPGFGRRSTRAEARLDRADPWVAFSLHARRAGWRRANSSARGAIRPRRYTRRQMRHPLSVFMFCVRPAQARAPHPHTHLVAGRISSACGKQPLRRLQDVIFNAAVALPACGGVVACDRIGASVPLCDQRVRIGSVFDQRVANSFRSSL
jgi:hypothetical protein